MRYSRRSTRSSSGTGHHLNAAILSIGSEIVQGFLSDTNSTYLARGLHELGIEVVGVFHVGDNVDHIVRALERATHDANLIVCTGGIGPTADDLTREAVATICNESPSIDPETLATVRSFFQRRGAEMPEQNAKQAWKIPSAEILPNPNGTAPGWLVRHDDSLIVLMPGVPREMMPMWNEQALPRISEHLPRHSIEAATLKTIGLGESLVERILSDIIGRGFPTVSTYAKNDGVHIRVVAAADNPAESVAAVETTLAEIREWLGVNVYGDLDTSLPEAVLQPLADMSVTVDIWESGTGGQVAALLLSENSVAQVVGVARVVGAAPSGGSVDPIECAETGLAELQASAHHRIGLAVSVVYDACDPFGRYDARVGVIVEHDRSLVKSEHRLSGVPREVGRRASLLAAEALRRVALDLAARQTS